MEIDFQIDELPSRFSRNWFTGSASLLVAGQAVNLADPLDLATHFNLSLAKNWNVTVRQHAIGIEMTRFRFFGGMRPITYRIFMDGQLVVERVGF